MTNYAIADRRAKSAALLLLVLIVGAQACSHAPPEDTRDYAQRLADDRAAKDELFKSRTDPIPDGRKAELLPLAYFPIDPDYDVPASLEPSDDPTILEVPTSAGTPRKMRKAGTLVFSLKGQPLRITAYHDLTTPASHLSVMFSDLSWCEQTAWLSDSCWQSLACTRRRWWCSARIWTRGTWARGRSTTGPTWRCSSTWPGR